MDNGIAQALMSIGQYIPQATRQNRLDTIANQDRIRKQQQEDEDRKAQAALNELLLKSKQQDYDTKNYEIDQRNKGDQALNQYQEDMRINPVIAELNKYNADTSNQSDQKPIIPIFGADIVKNKENIDKPQLSSTPTPYSLDYLGSQKASTPLGLANKNQLARYSANNKGAENTLEQLNKEEDNNLKYGNTKDGKISWGNKTGLIIDYRTPEKIEYVKQKLLEFKNDTGLDDNTYKQKLMDIENGEAYNVSQYINDQYSGEQKNRLGITKEYWMVAPKTATTEAITAARENTERRIQADNPILSENQGSALNDAYAGVNYMNQLKSFVKNGNIDFFDLTKAGEFKNPQAANAYRQLVEIIGRGRSGAAISNDEWKNFGKEILNKNSLITNEGKQTALQNIDDYIDRMYAAGVTTTGNEDWYNNYKSKAKSARSKAENTDDLQSVKRSQQDQEAIQWAKSNPNDPRAKKILQIHGM